MEKIYFITDSDHIIRFLNTFGTFLYELRNTGNPPYLKRVYYVEQYPSSISLFVHEHTSLLVIRAKRKDTLEKLDKIISRILPCL